MKSIFFDSEEIGLDDQGRPIYDRAADTAMVREVFKSFIGNGVYSNPSTEFQVLAGSGMKIIVKKGRVWINGAFAWLEDDLEIALPAALSTDSFIRVIIRLDLSLSARDIDIYTLRGTSPPEITRNDTIYDLVIADIKIPRNSTFIIQRNITDTRLNKSLCGIVTGVITQVDTTTLYNQVQGDLNDFRNNTQSEYNSWTAEKRTAYEIWISRQESDFEQWDGSFKQSYIADFEQYYQQFKQTNETDFNTWFTNLKNTLDENQAANLYNKIDNHENNTLTSSGGVHGLRINNGKLQGNMGVGWATLLTIPTGMTASYFDGLGLSVTQFNNLNWTVEDFNNQIMTEE